MSGAEKVSSSRYSHSFSSLADSFEVSAATKEHHFPPTWNCTPRRTASRSTMSLKRPSKRVLRSWPSASRADASQPRPCSSSDVAFFAASWWIVSPGLSRICMGISSSRGPWALVPRRMTEVGVACGASGPRRRYTVVRLKAKSGGMSCGAWRILGAGRETRCAYRSSTDELYAGGWVSSRSADVLNREIGFFSFV